MKGRLLIFSAPSGSGKSTLVHHLMGLNLGLSFSVSATSRKPRKGERNGIDYYFISPEEFRNKIAKNEFLEWEEVYTGQYYGTLRSELDRIWERGESAVFDIDVMGGLNLKKEFGDKACAVFVQAPSLDILAQRLRARSTDDDASIQKRLAKAAYEMEFAGQFDHILVNDSLDQAQQEVEKLVKDFMKNQAWQK